MIQAILLSGTCAAAVSTILYLVANSRVARQAWGRHRAAWKQHATLLQFPPAEFVPFLQAVGIVGSLVLSLSDLRFAALALPVMLVPGLLVKIATQRRQSMLVLQLDSTLASLSNSLSVTGNLHHGLIDVAAGEREPMKTELNRVIGEVRLGRTIEDALLDFGDRSGLPELQAAVAQIIVGKKTGGDISRILEITASSLREIRRLEGVVRTQTSEGKNQAIVIGLVPPVLCVLLHLINPGWLAPMWSQPLGWVLLGVCALLEITAILLIRKIVAVDI